MEKVEFENSLQKPKLALLASGLSINSVNNKYITFFLKTIFYFNIPWLYTDVLAEFFWLVEGAHEGKSLSELSFIAPCATICLLATAKSVPLYLNKETVITVVDKLREMHPEKSDKEFDDLKNDEENVTKEVDKREKERKIIQDSMFVLNGVVALLFYSSTVVVVMFTTLPIMTMAYDYYKGNEVELRLPFLSKYFFNPYTKTMWPIMYFHQIWSTYIAAFNVFGADTLLYAFCTYVKMHFQLMSANFRDIVSAPKQQVREKLTRFIKKHQELILIVDQVENIYSKSTLFNITTSSILICLSGFNVMFLEDLVSVCAFMTFLIMSLTQISLLCIFGDMLMSSSIELSEAIYNSTWYDIDISIQKDILFCLKRAQKPCKLTASNFADVKLTALTTILSRSWSLFALLRTMYD